MTVQTRPGWLRGGLVIFGAVAMFILAAGCSKKDGGGGGSDLFNGSAKKCKSFEGGQLSATWSDCPDKMKREVTCHMFVDELTCDCYEDGVKKWFFRAKDPPLSTREDATRIANKSCHWGLE